MGRVEKILVVAIFGVVVMILGVTAFLPDATREPARQDQGVSSGLDAGPSGATVARGDEALTPLERLLRSDLESGAPPAPADPAVGPAVGPAVEPPPGGGAAPAPLPAAVSGAGRLGQRVPTDPRYVKVQVAAGETLGEIVRRECGSLRFLEDARVLNEHLDADLVFAGQEILLPYVPPDKLPPPPALAGRAAGVESGAERGLATMPLVMRAPVRAEEEARDAPVRDAPMRDAPVRDAGRGPDVAPASYKVRKGETLWAIAQTRWGRGQAARKVAEILALNRDQLPSERALKAGQVIRLPR
jgi:nucleoid-associated protein YgaU